MRTMPMTATTTPAMVLKFEDSTPQRRIGGAKSAISDAMVPKEAQIVAPDFELRGESCGQVRDSGTSSI